MEIINYELDKVKELLRNSKDVYIEAYNSSNKLLGSWKNKKDFNSFRKFSLKTDKYTESGVDGYNYMYLLKDKKLFATIKLNSSQLYEIYQENKINKPFPCQSDNPVVDLTYI